MTQQSSTISQCCPNLSKPKLGRTHVVCLCFNAVPLATLAGSVYLGKTNVLGTPTAWVLKPQAPQFVLIKLELVPWSNSQAGRTAFELPYGAPSQHNPP